MPGNEVLLDTNALIALMRDDSHLLQVLADWRQVTISLFTLGEMYFGTAKSSQPEENNRRLAGFLDNLHLLLPDAQTADYYGLVFHRLKIKGRPIPTNDVWIAALAIEHHLPLLTRDAHFHEVSSLEVLSW